MKKSLICAALIIALSYITSISGLGVKEIDNPGNLNLGGGPEYSVFADSSCEPELFTVDKADIKNANIYKYRYGAHDEVISGGGIITVLEYDADEKLREQSEKTLEKYTSAAGTVYTEGDLIYSENGGGVTLIVKNENKTLKIFAIGEKLVISCKTGISDPELMEKYEKSDTIVEEKYVKAAFEISGLNLDSTFISFKKSDRFSDDTGKQYYMSNRSGAELIVYRKGADGKTIFEPAPVVYKTSLSGGILEYTVEVYTTDRGDEISGGRLISYEEAFKKLREGECFGRVTMPLDEIGLDYSDVFYELVYTTDVDHRYYLPCYKFYVRTMMQNQTPDIPVSENIRNYNSFYVPAVEFDPENPGTGDAGVYAVASVSLLCLFAAQYVYKKSKRG